MAGNSKTYKDKLGNIKYRGSRKSVLRGVMERFFGQELRKGSVAHHKNRDTPGNKPSQCVTAVQDEW